MKRFIGVLLITTGLGLSGIALYETFFWIDPAKKNVHVAQSYQKNFDTSFLIIDALTPPAGEIIVPSQMVDIEKIYKGINMIQIPRVFIDQLPSDFSIRSTADKTLFMKIITALMLRTNEQILKERKVIQILNDKLNNQVSWTDQETTFFNKMVEKYDAGLAKTIQSRMAQLMVKVDIIPVSIGVAQAILFSDWGKKNKKSIYGEFGWRDKEHYEPIRFDSLVAATDSYANALNSRSQLVGFREARKWMRPYAAQRSLGWDIAHNLNNYMEQEDQYGEKISQIYGQGLIKELDHACFKGACTFEP